MSLLRAIHDKGMLLIKFCISFKVYDKQSFLTSPGNLETSTRLLGSGTRCDTFVPDSSKVGNELFN